MVSGTKWHLFSVSRRVGRPHSFLSSFSCRFPVCFCSVSFSLRRTVRCRA
jgi:hypothetical protein